MYYTQRKNIYTNLRKRDKKFWEREKKTRNKSDDHIGTRKCSTTILGMAWSSTIKLFGKQQKKVCTLIHSNKCVLHASAHVHTYTQMQTQQIEWKKSSFSRFWTKSKVYTLYRWFYTWLSLYASCNTSCIWWFFRFHFRISHEQWHCFTIPSLTSFWRPFRVWVLNSEAQRRGKKCEKKNQSI